MKRTLFQSKVSKSGAFFFHFGKGLNSCLFKLNLHHRIGNLLSTNSPGSVRHVSPSFSRQIPCPSGVESCFLCLMDVLGISWARVSPGSVFLGQPPSGRSNRQSTLMSCAKAAPRTVEDWAASSVAQFRW